VLKPPLRATAVFFAVMASCRMAAAQDQPKYVLVFDQYMTPAAGTTDLLTIQRFLTAVEDRWLPPSRFDESTPLSHALGIGYRVGKWFALDLPQDQFLMVVGHEVFGHGARLREVGAAPISYRFDAPIPYGAGGAETSFNGEVSATRADALGIDSAGIEAQNVLADHIGRQAISNGYLPYREAWLYLQSRIAGLGYIQSVSPQSAPGHDVRDFLDDFNDQCNSPACTPLTESTLKRRAWLTLADPMLAYAGYTWAVSYVVRGESSGKVPMISLAHDVSYLPALRFEMTPYGTAVTTEHSFVYGHRLTLVTVGVGDTGHQHAWDVGVAASNVLHGGWWQADLKVDVWRQPALDSPPNAQVFMTGAFAAATARIPLGRRGSGWNRAGVIVEGGYKSDGFVRGERLHAGPVVRVGVTFRH
jgi:hypothetical protein